MATNQCQEVTDPNERRRAFQHAMPGMAAFQDAGVRQTEDGAWVTKCDGKVCESKLIPNMTFSTLLDSTPIYKRHGEVNVVYYTGHAHHETEVVARCNQG
jgi:hypothetical protein